VAAELVRGHLVEQLGVGPAPAEDHPRRVGGDDERVGVELASEQAAGPVLVDHGVDPRQPPFTVGGVGGRDAPAAGADDGAPPLEQPPHRPELEDAARGGRGHDPPEAVAVRGEAPPALGSQLFGLLGGVDRADRLRRVVERRIVEVHLDHGEQRRERMLRGQQVAELLLDEVADQPLGLRAEHVEGVRVDPRRVGGRLHREHPDLRTVAVGDDELVLERDGGERLAGVADVAALDLDGHRLPAPKQRVASERHHHPHPRPPRRGRHHRAGDDARP
jgi:hypothetical protein